MPNSKRTQKQILQGKDAHNDNIADTKIAAKIKNIEFAPASLETIDQALLRYIDDTLNLSVTTNEGFKKVPVLWVTAERAYQLKHNKELRDAEDTLILPLITVNRASIEKNPASEYAVPAANIPEVRDALGGSITIARRINQKKTAEFQNAYSKRKFGRQTWPEVKPGRVVYKTVSIPFPTWVALNYEISVRTEYQQQINEILRKFIRQGGLNRMPFRIEQEGHKFEAFIDGALTNNSNVSNLGMAQRNYETLIKIKVLGYLVGDGDNQERPNIVERENAVEVKIPRENVIFGNIQDFLDNSGFYKE
tara:strand:- start:228 stop:1148 length:921 start_codon:yes stop_codon:yes gene_type:complete